MTRKKCAYLTMDDLSDFVSDATMSVTPMSRLGWDIEWVSWRDRRAHWDRFDAVYICTPWDYQDDVAAFLRVLERIDRSSALLINDIELVRWNLRKTYLRELEARGAAIVPSRWFDSMRGIDLDDVRRSFDVERLVIKPVVGANADHTYIIDPNPSRELDRMLHETFHNRPFFVQPYLDRIEREGEYSLFFFGGAYSHAIRKVPASGDFRSQEEHGADILSAKAPADLVETAGNIMRMLEPQPVYGRGDFLRGGDGEFLLMELELIEPSLYFRADDLSADRFAFAIDQHVRGMTEGAVS